MSLIVRSGSPGAETAAELFARLGAPSSTLIGSIEFGRGREALIKR